MGLALVVSNQQEEPYAQVRDHLEGRVIGLLDSREAQMKTFAEVEELLLAEMLELGRKAMEEYVRRRGPGRVAGGVTGADGVLRQEPRMHDRDVETTFGTVLVERMGYGAEGVESMHPKDAALNLPRDLYSHFVRRRVAEEAARGAFDEVVSAVERGSAARIAKRQVEELVVRAALDFDTFYKERQRPTGEGSSDPAKILVLTTDGKGIVMRHKDLRKATRKAAEKRTQKPDSPHSKGEKRNAKRMSTVAAVYEIAPYERTAEEILSPKGALRELLDARRPRPEAKRVWASVAKKPKRVIQEMFAEALRRDPERRMRWIALVDGAKPQLKQLRECAKTNGVALEIILDIYHVTEYVWKAGSAFFAQDAPEREIWVRDQILEVLHGNGRHAAALMRRKATLGGLTARRRKPVDKCAGYLTAYVDYQHYDRYLGAGMPIGTGVIEGACRHLVKDRMDLTGARWSLKGAEAVLRLRALRSSGDLDAYWPFHEACEHKRNHASQYAGGKAPQFQDEPRPSPPPPLRLLE